MIAEEVHIVDIEKKKIVHKIVAEDDVCFLHWAQETSDNPNRYEAYQKLVSIIDKCTLKPTQRDKHDIDPNLDARCRVEL